MKNILGKLNKLSPMEDKEFFDSDINDILESERLEILLGVFDKLSTERSYTTGELLWNEEWLKERLFGEDLK